ncbi:MAG: peptidase [Gammaproteobacteria bacterium RIFCSPLOWO2_12_FULL_52_10]|nr:MAG: peptidase [Gammaproteobacteria bacterium RIFCSPLOWO2_12_FULL_52_10]
MPEFPLLQEIIIYAIPILFAITVHEVAHGWVASKLGDQTAKQLGRLTLNPIKHIDPIGTILVPIVLSTFGGFIFGWAKPVPVDWRNLRKPKRDMAWVAIAGPCANLLMVLLWAGLIKLILVTGDGSSGPVMALLEMAKIGVQINAFLMILNLLPLPPLDGSRILTALLPPLWAYRFNQLERVGLIIILVLLVTGLLLKILLPVYYRFVALISLIFGL